MSKKRIPMPRRLLAGVAAFLIAVQPLQALAQDTSGAPTSRVLTGPDLDALVAPIALYPDALIAQVLVAATYPLELVQADRWRQSNARLQGKALEDGLAQQTWDPSVAWLTHFPDLLSRMAQNLDWTQDLGDAFLGQQSEVMAAVQRMRQRADQAGALQSTPQQTVVKEKQVIQIVPANPEVVYVPQYNPTIVYGSAFVPPPAYYYPGMYAYAPGAIVATSMLSFGVGLAVGSLAWGGGCNWYGGNVYVGPGYWGAGGWGSATIAGATAATAGRATATAPVRAMAAGTSPVAGTTTTTGTTTTVRATTTARVATTATATTTTPARVATTASTTTAPGMAIVPAVGTPGRATAPGPAIVPAVEARGRATAPARWEVACPRPARRKSRVVTAPRWVAPHPA